MLCVYALKRVGPRANEMSANWFPNRINKPQMTDRVKLYQQKAHLPVTGEIDKQTRDKLLAEKGTNR
jgi:hypothetical protein